MNEEALFALALEKKNAAERQALLDQACAGNAQLRAAIEGLLKASADAGSFLEHPPLPLDATVVSSATSRDTAAAAEWVARLSFLKPCEKPDRLGKLVSKAGEYEIIEVVGHGGMGAVLRAFDTKLSRVVAVKVMAPELAANPVAVRRFLREATTAAAVHHEHVVTIHAVDDSHQPPYLVMQFVEGQTLQDKIDREGALELKHILRIGSQAAAGLAAAHKTGLIHRDVKPSNILLENGVERVKISDFGLARAADDVQMTQTGIISGTPQYMSPEQAKGEPIDAKSDLFSLGSVLYTMCTGRPAFRADNPIAVLRRVIDDAPRPIHEINAEIPQWLCDIIEKLLEKKPEARFQSAAEIADLLAAHLAHLQQPASCPMPPRIGSRQAGIPAPACEVIRKEARFYWATGIMCLVFAGFAALMTIVILRGRALPFPNGLMNWLITGGLLSLPVGVLIIYAAWQVEKRESLNWALAAGFLSLLPINPFLIFCLPISIWSLATVLRSVGQSRLALEPASKKPPVTAASVESSGPPPPFWMVGFGLLFGVFAMFVAVLKVVFGFNTRTIEPAFVVLIFAFMVGVVVWVFTDQVRRMRTVRRQGSEAKPFKPTTRGVFIEHPVLGCLAIFLLLASGSAATYMLTAAAFRPTSNRGSLTGQMDFVVRAAKGELTTSERLRLPDTNPDLIGQLGDPPTKAIMVFFAELPEASRREILEKGYAKWPVSSLPPAGQNAITALEATLTSEPANSHRNSQDLKQAHAGFAVVDLSHNRQQVISWFLIWPTQQRHEWVTIVNVKALDNSPAYFAAHHNRLTELRKLPDTTPSKTPTSPPPAASSQTRPESD